MLAEIIDNKAATGDHLLTIGADDIQRALHQLGGNAAAAQLRGVSVWVMMTAFGVSR